MRGILSRRAVESAVFALLILTCACAGDGSSSTVPSSTSTTMSGGTGTSLAQIQQSIFTPSCGFSGCHDSLTAAGNLDLSTTAASFDELVDVVSECGTAVRVMPGDPAASYLLDKLGDGASPCGFVMPIGASQLSQSELDQIRSWIQGGAPASLYSDVPVSTTLGNTSTTSTTLSTRSTHRPRRNGSRR